MSGILQLVNTFPSGGFAVKNSLRFRSSASAYLNRTPSVAGNQTTWTWSGWIKKGNLTVFEHLFGAASSVSNRFSFNFDNSVASGTNGDYLCAFIVLGGTLTNLFQTNALFRDPSSWYHIVLAVDTTQATSTNRLKLYVNGVQQTFSTYSAPAQNTAMLVNSAIAHNIASGAYSAGTFTFDGYMAEVNFVDGQALTPSSFGAFDATSGVWQATKYSGTYGTNGFYLKFSDTTSTTTLCYDYSGNSNNWTPNNISLTAGSTYDSMLDSPTNYDNGGNGVGNYAVLNPLDLVSPSTLSAGNLNFNTGIAGGGGVNANWQFPLTGKFYFEFSNLSGVSTANGRALCANALWESNTGVLYVNGSSVATIGGYTDGDTLAFATDCAAQTIAVYKNNTLLYTASAGANLYLSPVAGFRDGSGSNGITGSINFGQRPFAYTPPTGFKSLCTQNLPAPAIYNGANHMNAVLRNGFATSGGSVTSLAFQPDFFWEKARNNAYNHQLVDSVRGVSNVLNSNLTNAETSQPTYVTSFNSNGYTLGSNDYGTSVTLVDWVWKANGAPVTNTAGTITSSVSANTTAGFSVVTYTGTGSAATIGHGLGVAPSFIIVKWRSGGSTQGWPVYHVTQGNQAYLALNSTAAVTTSYPTMWNSTTPTSTVFSVGTGETWTNNSAWTYVAYCFAAIPGYSAFGSYTGNGSTDGPFVYLGFRPRYFLFKRTDTNGYVWGVLDTARNTYNVASSWLYPNDSIAEAQYSSFDFLSNGMKLRNTDAAMNASGATYIYAAFAESPFQYSLAR